MYYRHFKGKYYQTVATALDTRTEEVVVIYRTLYPSDFAWFTRPESEFHGMKELEDGSRVGRFVKVEESQLPTDIQEFISNNPVMGF